MITDMLGNGLAVGDLVTLIGDNVGSHLSSLRVTRITKKNVSLAWSGDGKRYGTIPIHKNAIPVIHESKFSPMLDIYGVRFVPYIFVLRELMFAK
jgi:hypothetical protein